MRLVNFAFIAVFLILAQMTTVNAQQFRDPDIIGKPKTADDLKTGNALDVLTNFFQLGVGDNTGDGKTLYFRSTLFAIKSKVDTTLLIDYNFKKQRFARNLQFEFAVMANEGFKINSLSAGLTYAIINNRDRKNANFKATFLNDIKAEVANTLSIVDDAYWDSINKDENLTSKQRQEIQRKFVDGRKKYDSTGNSDGFPNDYSEKLRAAGVFDLVDKYKAGYDSLMEDIGKRALVTASAFARTDSISKKFNQANLQLVYLKGNKFQADIRTILSYKDTAVSITESRRLYFKGNAGLDIVLFADKKDKKPVLELKPNLEYYHVFEGQLPGEQRETFFANAELRLRITEKIWIPFTIKYDIERANFLGFFNVTANLGSFK